MVVYIAKVFKSTNKKYFCFNLLLKSSYICSVSITIDYRLSIKLSMLDVVYSCVEK
jgi:hypothetical protein